MYINNITYTSYHDTSIFHNRMGICTHMRNRDTIPYLHEVTHDTRGAYHDAPRDARSAVQCSAVQAAERHLHLHLQSARQACRRASASTLWDEGGRHEGNKFCHCPSTTSHSTDFLSFYLTSIPLTSFDALVSRPARAGAGAVRAS